AGVARSETGFEFLGVRGSPQRISQFPSPNRTGGNRQERSSDYERGGKLDEYRLSPHQGGKRGATYDGDQDQGGTDRSRPIPEKRFECGPHWPRQASGDDGHAQDVAGAQFHVSVSAPGEHARQQSPPSNDQNGSEHQIE